MPQTMSHSSPNYAVGVVGIRHPPGVIRDKLYVEAHVRGCSHPIENTTKFCPECGAAAYENAQCPIDAYSVENNRLFNYTLVHRGAGFYANPEYIAHWCSGLIPSGESGFLPMCRLREMDFFHIKNTMQTRLEPLNLFNKDTFGLHVFLYESYD